MSVEPPDGPVQADAELPPPVADCGAALASPDRRMPPSSCENAEDTDNADIEEGEVLEEGEISDEEPEPEKPEKPTTSGAEKSESRRSRKASKSKDVNIEDFVAKKRAELQNKVRAQIESAGQTSKSSSGRAAAANADADEKRDTAKHARYTDLDPKPSTADVTDTMINNWASRKRPHAPSAANAHFDPNEEYYGYGNQSPPAASSSTAASSNATASDKDYRTGALDKDYRWPLPPPSYGSDEEERSLLRSPVDGARPPSSNEYGDRDYRDRARPPAAHGSDAARHRRRRSGSVDLTPQSPPAVAPPEPGRRSRGDRRKRRRSRSPTPLRRRPSRWSDRPHICKFFREGFCRDGESCSYSHSAADSMRKAELCKYYQQGYCKKSLQCPFLHGEYPCKAFHKGECTKDQCQFSHHPLDDFTQPVFDQMLRDEELAARINIPSVPVKRTVLLPLPPANYMFGRVAPFVGASTDELNQLRKDAELTASIAAEAEKAALHAMAVANRDADAAAFAARSGTPNASPFRVPLLANAPEPLSASPLHQPFLPVRADHDLPPDHVAESRLADNSSAPSVNINLMLQSLRNKVHGGDDEIDESPASPPMASNEAPISAALPQCIPQHGVPIYRLIIVDVAHRPNSNLDAALLQASLTDPKLRNDPRIKRVLDSQFNAVSKLITAQSADVKEDIDQRPRDPRAARDPRLQRQKQAASQQSSPPRAEPVAAAHSTDELMRELIERQLQMAAQQQMAMAPPPPAILPPPPSLDVGNPMVSGMAAPMAGPVMPVLVAPPPQHSLSDAWMPQMSALDMPPPFSAAADASHTPLLPTPTHAPLSEHMPLKKDPRMRQSRWHQNSPPDRFLEDSPPESDGARPLSLREKRKDLLYESPLGRPNGGSDISRYNQMPNVKVRRKTPPKIEGF